MLCYRCEHRAQFLEEGRRPRHECGNVESSVMGCYMFKPTKPITIKPREGDDRPLTLSVLSCRVERDDDIELYLNSGLIDDKLVIYWEPIKNKKDE